MLSIYAAYATLIAFATWRNWWLDARIAAVAHLVDMAVFTLIIFSTNGYTSPFFLFFVLPLLSAAIRWGWRETALTALALVLLYFVGSLLFSSGEAFQLQRFMARSAHLIILSAMLIWFGIHQRSARLFFHLDEFDALLPEDADARERALRLVMREAAAGRGMLLLRSSATDALTGPMIEGERISRATVASDLYRPDLRRRPLLFARKTNRTLAKTARRHAIFGKVSSDLDPHGIAELNLSEGLICPVMTGTAQGWLILEQVPDLSTDYLDIGEDLGHAVAAMLERYALLGAVEETAGARARLTLARDVHDSIVQFLAGATFRVEAINRARRDGKDIEPDLQELKQLLVDEQRDVRDFVSAVRRERTIGLREVVADIRGLAARLSQQWSVECRVSEEGPDAPIPMRLQLDVQQLVREAVANAVRHGQADRVDITLAARADQLRLDVLDNGRGFAMIGSSGPAPQPWSLKDRVDRAKGSLMMMSEPGRTQISIILPLEGAVP